MKTVLIDNSLCTFPLDKAASPEHIKHYIEALAEAGIKYVELDFRTIMKMTELPDGVGYIFRLGDPMFAEMSEVFDFKYVVVTLPDLKKRIKVNAPVILELPASQEFSMPLMKLAQTQLSSDISLVRLRGSYSLESFSTAANYIRAVKNAIPVPVDICPMNRYKTALDTAIKFSKANVDSITMSLGISDNYASIEEFVFTLMSVHEVMLKEINIAALCRATIYHQLLFGSNSCDSIYRIMNLLDHDIADLRNADTGRRVPMKVMLKDKAMLKRTFLTALESFIENEDIPEDFAYDITEAIKHFDTPIYNSELLYGYPKGNLQ